MNDPTRVLLIRGASLFLPALVLLALLLFRPRGRDRGAALLAFLWCFSSLLACCELADNAGWWRFSVQGGTLGATPVDALIGWSILFGALPALLGPARWLGARRELARLALGMTLLLWLDLLSMPRAEPVLELGPDWLLGEALALLLAFVPAQLLARLTRSARGLHLRASLGVALFAATFLGLLPRAVFELTGGSFRPGLGPAGGLLLQAVLLLGLPGLSAVIELVHIGQGTPLPFDPPSRLVETGLYRYLASPMMLSSACLITGWGLYHASLPLVAGGPLILIYGLGIARYSEDQDMARRFGPEWSRRQQALSRLWPRWRPYVPRPARLYFAAGCDPCESLAAQLGGWSPLGLEIVPAHTRPQGMPERLTYACDGVECVGLSALARALEHVNLAWALLGAGLRLPGVAQLGQLILDAVGGGPRRLHELRR